MSKNDDQGRLPPPKNTPPALREGESFPDPIEALTSGLGDDPALGDLIAFRQIRPDLKEAARMSRQFNNEAHRVAYAVDRHPQANTVAAGLGLAALLFDSLVCVWPADSLDEVDAKLALAHGRGPFGTDQEADYVASLEPATARRIRVMRAAFHVGELTVPPAPPAPSLDDRNLAAWPRLRYDLRDLLPLRGGQPVLTIAPESWIAFARSGPDFGGLRDRIVRMLATTERLFDLARANEDGKSRELRLAAEGAQILAYLSACQAMIWPVRTKADIYRKRVMAQIINDRACRPDPLHQQAAVRHIVDEAVWVHRRLGLSEPALFTPDWIEIV
ncbi:hypothetical protein [Bosea sp. (in: a-proteobacteria)]|uniref:hypothetical protein n=1 Tax=Bosea sp. (in: a-proteobacteria) TaxID=1871050 RepID=UPI002B480308|nr:hypothetical protein [Bosea sp. (in: a-proteobacteria)]WRH60138.1 MAG: hypothetical protein RSE11_10340 [Bosea sp. (in: a-proteobacteria)]